MKSAIEQLMIRWGKNTKHTEWRGVKAGLCW